jgi:Ca2+-binding RTX toxin-like protein
MTTFTVTTLIDESDAGATAVAPGGTGLSLREAIDLAFSGDTITFENGLSGGEIDLVFGELLIEDKFPSSNPLTIDGDLDDDSIPDITIDAQGMSRVIEIAPDGDSGIVAPNTAVTIDGLIVTGGHASQDAGIQARSSALEVRNSWIIDNHADGLGGGIGINSQIGGPIVTENSIVNCIIANNTAEDSAGIAFRRAELTIVNSLIADNAATEGFVGGIRGWDARDLTIVNSTVSGNSVTGPGDSARVGGIGVASVAASATTRLDNVTVTGNTASGGLGELTGGVRAFGEDIELRNTIIAGNAAAGLVSDVGSPVTSSNGHNIFSQSTVDGTVPGDLTGVPAQDIFADFGPVGSTGGITGPIIYRGILADNGGLSQTVALAPDGPAVDGGDHISLYDPGPDREYGTADDTLLFTDQRGPGFSREIWLLAGGVDVGAFELQDLPVLFTPLADSVNLNGFDLTGFANSTDALGGDDVVTLSETQNLGLAFFGGGGADSITGSASGDEIRGDNGDDTLVGRGGADQLYGGNGDDLLNGGDGDDVLAGRADDDRLFGRAGADSLFGEGGDDILAGNDGEDTLSGGDGEDVLSGNAGDDTLSGGAGGDLLSGGGDDDLLFGGAGEDTLNGGQGRDLLIGGQDFDVFLFSSTGDSATGAQRDVIDGFDGIGFVPGDRVDLSGIDAVAGGGDNAFAFIGVAAFSAPGQIRVFNQGGDTIIAGNTAGGTAAEFEIAVTDAGINAGAWRGADFIL